MIRRRETGQTEQRYRAGAGPAGQFSPSVRSDGGGEPPGGLHHLHHLRPSLEGRRPALPLGSLRPAPAGHDDEAGGQADQSEPHQDLGNVRRPGPPSIHRGSPPVSGAAATAASVQGNGLETLLNNNKTSVIVLGMALTGKQWAPPLLQYQCEATRTV